MKKAITSSAAPEAIGHYSQAAKCANSLYVSGQIALDPHSVQMVESIEAQTRQVFAVIAC